MSKALKCKSFFDWEQALSIKKKRKPVKKKFKSVKKKNNTTSLGVSKAGLKTFLENWKRKNL